MTSVTYLEAAAVAALLGFVLPEPLATIANVLAFVLAGTYADSMVYGTTTPTEKETGSEATEVPGRQPAGRHRTIGSPG